MIPKTAGGLRVPGKERIEMKCKFCKTEIPIIPEPDRAHIAGVNAALKYLNRNEPSEYAPASWTLWCVIITSAFWLAVIAAIAATKV